MTESGSNELVVLGLSHHTAPLEMREAFSLTAKGIDRVYKDLKNESAVQEAAVLGTCNRLEVYATGSADDLAVCLSEILSRQTGQGQAALREICYFRRQQAAAQHLFEVAAGLDSQMIGETEIFGQVKKAYQDAVDREMVGGTLHRVFQKSFRQGKWARTHTQIGTGNVSVATVAAELATRIFGRIRDCALLVVGTGEVAESTLKVFLSEGCKKIGFCGRNEERRLALEETIDVQGYPLEELEARLGEFDIVVTSTASEDYLITHHNLPGKRTRPLFFIDVAVPRDVDPACGDSDQIFVYNMDDLAKVANENMELRKQEIERCSRHLKLAAEEWLSSSRPSNDRASE